jgi:hypothetical protein
MSASNSRLRQRAAFGFGRIGGCHHPVPKSSARLPPEVAMDEFEVVKYLDRAVAGTCGLDPESVEAPSSPVPAAPEESTRGFFPS